MKKVSPLENHYRSPYILLAEYKAQKRARQALALLKPRRSINVLQDATNQSPPRGDWNNKIESDRLFDPSIHKVEIFRPGYDKKNEDNVENNYKHIIRSHTTDNKRPAHSSPTLRVNQVYITIICSMSLCLDLYTHHLLSCQDIKKAVQQSNQQSTLIEEAL